MFLSWQLNTAIDLFYSAAVIFNPDEFELRPAWAAGVRARLSPEARETLEEVYRLPWLPIGWFYPLGLTVDAAQALDQLAQLPPERRITDLILTDLDDAPAVSAEVRLLIDGIIARGQVTDAEVKAVRQGFKKGKGHHKDLRPWLEILAAGRRLGPHFLPALRDFYDIFYREEERRVRPFLERSIAEGQRLSEEVNLTALLEHLSQGINYTLRPAIQRLVLAPSFWTTPLIADGLVGEDTLFFIYGARPAEASLVPGETVPDEMQQALKTLADPTRLKILKLLRHQPHTAGELAQALRLRPPTVTHHLKALRMVRLVRITLAEDDRRTYEFRPDGLTGVLESILHFLDLK